MDSVAKCDLSAASKHECGPSSSKNKSTHSDGLISAEKYA